MRRRNGALLLLVALVVVVAFPSTALARRALGLSASKFEFKAEPGKIGKGQVYVINEGDEPIQVRVYAANQIVNGKGQASYVVPTVDDDPLQSPASWVRLHMPANAKAIANVPYIELGPSQRVPVNFSVEIPERVVPGDKQIILFFEMFDHAGSNSKSSARVLARVGARITTHILGAAVEILDVQPFNFPRFVVGSKANYSYVIQNQGNIDKRVNTSLSALDYSGNEVDRKPLLADVPIYAGTNYENQGQVKFSPFKIGRVTYRLNMDYKTGELTSVGFDKRVKLDRVVWVFPLWLVVSIAVVFVAIAFYATWRSGGRTASRKMREEEYRRRIEELEQELNSSESA